MQGAAWRSALVVGLLLCPTTRTAIAADTELSGISPDTDANGPEVSGTIAVGVINASGNTESTSTNLDLALDIVDERWRHNLLFNAYVASEQGETNAERYGTQLQSEYRITERTYVFGLGRYETNRFGLYDRRTSLSFGLGRRVVDREQLTLDLEAGVGHRESEPTGSAETETETTNVLRSDLTWAFSEHGELSSVLEVESGELNTASRSVTSLKSKLTEDLAWRLSYTVEHNSEVPAGIEQTDTLTTVSLQYGF